MDGMTFIVQIHTAETGLPMYGCGSHYQRLESRRGAPLVCSLSAVCTGKKRHAQHSSSRSGTNERVKAQPRERGRPATAQRLPRQRGGPAGRQVASAPASRAQRGRALFYYPVWGVFKSVKVRL